MSSGHASSTSVERLPRLSHGLQRVDVMKRLATTSTVVARKPHNSNAVNAAGERRAPGLLDTGLVLAFALLQKPTG